ncbi:hypothetical protein GOBAR_AA01700 [Gossypium barbadense]|uniref:DUF3730 domain-containing protein n=2 Tax=Gossypium barbadense TaxID=3634 RepID=A0A2P5YTI1_GOSBA|nr:hypothetical protein GOBAR_AA01700 [Gossypium barbadense]
MDSYTSLLEKTRLPQPSLQKFAVISIFSKLQTAPVRLGPDSEPGAQAISQCLQSSSPAVVDQSVREVCRLVLNSNMDLSRALLELQSALEGSDPKFVPLFVKSLGFLVCVGYERSNGSWKPESHEDHPFVKILSSRREVERELVNQVLLFMAKNKGLGMAEVCEFLRHFLIFSILRMNASDSSLFLFARQLITSMASFCCSIPNQALPIFRALIHCLKYFPLKSLEVTRNFCYVVECLVDSFTVVLRQLVGKGVLITEAQLCGVELIENVLSLYMSPCKQSDEIEPIVELLKHMLVAQKDLALHYMPELASVILSLSVLLIESDLEHQQLSILKFLQFLLYEELLVIFPVISLISSPSKSVKGAANDLLVLLERLLVKLLTMPKINLAKKVGYPSISRPELIAYRLLQHLWFEDRNSLSSSFFLSFSSVCGTDVQEMHGRPRSWAYQLKELALWIVERRKSGLPVPRSQEILLTEMPLLFGAIAAVLVMHPSLGSTAIDALASIGNMDPKLGVSLLLSILFYNNIFTRKDVVYQSMLPKLLGMLPSLASQTGMIPLVVQTILPMLHKDAKPVLYATATRLLCQTWEINDRTFSSLQVSTIAFLLLLVLPPSAHTIKSTASKFLLGWLFQYEHEHRQWSAAISLGLISSSLHVTDHEQKFQSITGLLEVLCCSRSSIVKGACGIGLGFSCQDLLSRVETPDDSNANGESHKMLEERLLGRIVRTFSMILHPVAASSANNLETLCAHFPASTDDIDTSITSDLLDDDCDYLEDDIWGIAGLVIGLGSSIGAIYRAGVYDAVLTVKDLIISWIPPMSSSVQSYGSSSERSEMLLSVGSCLALPLVVAFCQRVEMMDGNELDHLVNGYMELISDLLSVHKTGAFHKSLLMASTAGAGSLLSCILSEGLHFIEVERVKCLLELFRKCYSSPYPPIVHLGGMLGIVNAFGAGAGNLVDFHPFNSSVQTGYDQKEPSHISGPILVNPVCEDHSTSLMQEIFLVAQNPDDNQLQQYAAWAISFLRQRLWSREISNSAGGTQTESAGSKSISQGVPEDSAVMKLGLWLKSFNHSRTGTNTHVCTVTAILRCLSLAPRLPTMDWGAIVRRCMRYAQVTQLPAPNITLKGGTLREECLQFALVHAKQFDGLLTFLDELSDLSRFRTLEISLQSCLLNHLADLIKLFSGSRLEKLLDDVSNYFSSLTTDQVLKSEERSSLRSSCWKGLNQCLDEASLDSLEYIKNIERCMEVLFSLLPLPQAPVIVQVNQLNSVEWSEAVRCLAKARPGWLLDFLHV